jgi:hypothetical protein
MLNQSEKELTFKGAQGFQMSLAPSGSVDPMNIAPYANTVDNFTVLLWFLPPPNPYTKTTSFITVGIDVVPHFQKTNKKNFDGIMIYFWWHIWKERNRRISQQLEKLPRQVTSLCKDDITQYNLETQPQLTIV